MKANRPDAHGEIKRVFADEDVGRPGAVSGAPAYQTMRAAKPSLGCTAWKTAKSLDTGMSFRAIPEASTTTPC